MTSFKVKYRASAVTGKKVSIYYQVIHNSMIRQLSTDYHIMSCEWDRKSSNVVAKDVKREEYIKEVRMRIQRDLKRLNRITVRLNENAVIFTADDICFEYKRFSKEYTFFIYMHANIERLRKNGNIGTAGNYRSALNSFRKFRKNEDLLLDSITPDLMERYEAWLKNRNIIPNTVSFYTRIFRAVYNRAVEHEIIEDAHPFKRVYTGVDKTEKRALPLKSIRKMKALDLTMKPKLDFARDIFFLSFYMRGMSFIDLCFLRKSDLKDGIVTYRRRKTGQQLSIAWTKEMQEILDKYPSNESEYLLPIITHRGINERWAYKNAGYKVNSNLKKIGELAGATDFENWSLYRARHSWASLAKSKGIPVRVISEAMGHENETTTQIYLSSLEASVVDHANSIVIGAI